MAKDQGLKALLKKHKGVDHKQERQKKMVKQADKRKRAKAPVEEEESDEEIVEGGEGDNDVGIDSDAEEDGTLEDIPEAEVAAKIAELQKLMAGGELEDSEDDDEDEEDEEGGIDLEQIDSSESESELDNDDDEEEEEEDIPLSDIESLASEDRGDVIPHQRLTINNTAALQRSLKSFALPASLPFSATQAVVGEAPTEIKDVEDDLTRELAFYKQSLDAVKEARIKLNKEGVPFSRPVDFFAEMVKSEEQMGKVRGKMVEAAARKKASSDARRQRDLKKFGKAVQVAKLQERDKAKRDTLEKINVMKRKRAGGNELTTNEEDMFDVALDDAGRPDKDSGEKGARRFKDGRGGPERTGEKGNKRQKKDAKFGFGGKKRFGKSNDAKSAGDVSGFSAKKMKGKAPRPGKSKRAGAGRK